MAAATPAVGADDMCDDDDDTPWQPPMRSTGSRSFPARSKSSVRGFLLALLPAEEQWRQIIYESNLERQTALLLLARPDIWNLWDQPPKVTFTDASGRTAHHTFDYLAQFRDGSKWAVAVKPEARVARIGFRQTLACIRADLPRRFAGEVVLVTEKDLHPAEVSNAELLHLFRMHPDPEVDRIIADLIARGPAERSIADIVSEAGLEGHAFRAVVRAIYAGHARADLRRRITPATIITRSGGPS